MTEHAQTSAHKRQAARRRPLVQYEIVAVVDPRLPGYAIHESPAGSKPSHQLIHPAKLFARATSLDQARDFIPAGYKRLARRKDDRADVVEVWV